LIDEDERSRRQILAERPHRGKRDEIGHTDPLQGVDIGAVVDVARREAVAAAVPGKESDIGLADPSDPDCIRRLAPRTLDHAPFGALHAGYIVDARAADNA